jgi:peptidoglycan/xylan/chitin deacetylase (PgdA/CDA1 family)
MRTAWPVIGGAWLAACAPVDIAELDGPFYDGDGRSVHCAVDLDTVAGNSLASIDGALDRAAARGEVVELYAHKPGITVPLDRIEHVLAGAQDRGLAFVTYADFAAGAGTGPAIALSFDDSAVATWIAAQPLFERHGARATFFVSRFHAFSETARAQLHELAVAGHAIEAHSVLHERAPTYVEEHGLAAYLDDEVVPSIDALVAEGFSVTSFAYPYGARTDELDRAILELEHVAVLRSVSFSYTGVVQSPCPR